MNEVEQIRDAWRQLINSVPSELPQFQQMSWYDAVQYAGLWPSLAECCERAGVAVPDVGSQAWLELISGSRWCQECGQAVQYGSDDVLCSGCRAAAYDQEV